MRGDGRYHGNTRWALPWQHALLGTGWPLSGDRAMQICVLFDSMRDFYACIVNSIVFCFRSEFRRVHKNRFAQSAISPSSLELDT